MDRSQLSMEEYGALHEDSMPPEVELSKDDIIAKWSDRYDRLKASAARQVSELSDQLSTLTARVGFLEALLEQHGISADDEGVLSLEQGLEVLRTGLLPSRPAISGGDGGSVAGATLALPSAPSTSLSAAHGTQNIISVDVAGRIMELEDMPALVLTGGADKKLVASIMTAGGSSLTTAGSVGLSAPVLDLSCHPKCFSEVDGALCAAALMDGSVVLVSASVDLSARVAVSARPPITLRVADTQNHHSKFVTRVKWSPRGEYLAACSQDGGLSLFDMNLESASLSKRTTLTFAAPVEAIEFFINDVDRLILIAAVRGAPVLFYIDVETQSITQVGISEDSGRPVEGAGATPHPGFTKVGFNVLDVCLSPCGRYLAVSTDHSYHFLYKPGTSTILKRLCGHTVNDMSSVRVAWHPTSQWLCSTSDRDNCVYVWSVDTERVVGKVAQHSSRVRSLVCWHDARNDNSAYLVTVSFDKTSQVWPLSWS